jgi:uncharacterized protein (DUF1800 family)
MTDASIALNRFGLGGRPGEDPGSDPRKWLTSQIQSFDPRPQVIASQVPSTQVARDLADFYEQQRQLRETLGPKSERKAPSTPAGAQAPMAGGGAMQDMQSAPPAMQQGMMQDGMAAQPAGAKLQPAVNAKGKKLYEGEDAAMVARREARKIQQQAYVSMVAARALTAITSPTPFAERLTHFWANHFAVSADKLELVGMCGTLEFEAIRPHVMGKFGDMLNAVERHPAMLMFLDQAQSIGPNSPAGQISAKRKAKNRAGLNENLAREIMELHTLGVRSVYTQADVTEFARAMTGFTLQGIGRGGGAKYAGIADGTPGTFVFADRLHEPGTRAILGKQWSQQGEAQAGAVLNYLATHPATAHHIATKLARHFAADDPPATLVAKLEKAFLSSGGDLPTVYRTLINAPECWAPQPAKFKSPWEWSISAMRALGTKQVQANTVNGLMGQLGQPTWKPGSPAGWDDVAGAWAGPDAIMRRVEAAERMAQRAKDTIDARQRAVELFPGALTPGTAQSIARAESPGQGLALMLVSPEFMRR